MAIGTSSTQGSIDAHHGYLLVLAESQIGPTLRTAVDAADLVQQTLLKACQHAATFRGTERELRAWLRSILTNTIADHLRKFAGNDGRCPRSLEAALESSSRRLEGLLQDRGSSPSHKAQRNEASLVLADALARLPEDQRFAVELRHLQGLPLTAIADQMGKTVAAVAGLLRRGLEALRSDLRRTL